MKCIATGVKLPRELDATIKSIDKNLYFNLLIQNKSSLGYGVILEIPLKALLSTIDKSEPSTKLSPLQSSGT